MATFSRSTFNATKYAASRPHYPPALYSHVLDYASLESTTTAPRILVDVGCGPGLSTFSFAPHFDRVIGIDPSENMVNSARTILEQREGDGEIEKDRVRFERGRGDKLEDISGLERESVDLVVAGQAAHWFDPLPTYKSLAKVLKPGGSFVFWGYGEIFFPNRPELSSLIPPYSGKLLGPYWEQPGRSIVENLLVPFPLPIPSNFPSSSEANSICSSFDPSSLKRTFHLQNPSSSETILPKPLSSESNLSTSLHPLLLTKTWNLQGLEGYLRTWSSLHKYEEENGKEPDVVARLLEQLREKGWKEGEEVEVGWEVGMFMGKKKEE
ncbi:hypothetical protein JCM16303_002954 [Sporobolomyces ruberrimus]